MTFTMPTSGKVRVLTDNTGGEKTFVLYAWHNLDAFTQGYVEAAYHSAFGGDLQPDGSWLMRVGFDHLAPETLATILTDCAQFCRESTWPTNLKEAGADFWRERQERSMAGALIIGEVLKPYPPLTAYLGDDGKVRLATSETKGLEQQ